MCIAPQCAHSSLRRANLVPRPVLGNINYGHMFSKCFRSLHTLLSLALCFVSSIGIDVTFTEFCPVLEFLVNSHTAKTGRPKWCLYIFRRLQWTAVNCVRSNCNNIENNFLKNREHRSYEIFQKRTGFPVLSCRFVYILIYRLSVNYYELHQEPLHCHQLEEELDDGCRS